MCQMHSMPMTRDPFLCLGAVGAGALCAAGFDPFHQIWPPQASPGADFFFHFSFFLKHIFFFWPHMGCALQFFRLYFKIQGSVAERLGINKFI